MNHFCHWSIREKRNAFGNRSNFLFEHHNGNRLTSPIINRILLCSQLILVRRLPIFSLATGSGRLIFMIYMARSAMGRSRLQQRLCRFCGFAVSDSGDGYSNNVNIAMAKLGPDWQYLNHYDRALERGLANQIVKRPMMKLLMYVSPFAFIGSFVFAQTAPNTGVGQLPAQSTAIKGVLVPVPKEIFGTLDKFAHSNWRAVQRPELTQSKTPSNQAETALMLGVVIAEGFIAVEAEDAAEVKNVGRAVLKLARALGVEQAALRRSRSIVEHAEAGDWTGVRKEWDGVLPDVQRGMNELKSEQLAQLVSLGGW
ncbi:MAG: hypothetical protein JWO45_1116, partial [Spartobacteria bacterium]|nr:hypothetical protein [Spartobacteria bacterium]